MKIFQWERSCSLRTKGRQTDRHDEANSCFSQFCERVQKLFVHNVLNTGPTKWSLFSVFLGLRVACVFTTHMHDTWVQRRQIYKVLISSKIRFSLWFSNPNDTWCPSQWPRGLKRRSAAARLMGLWVRITLGAWMFDCCVCCQVEVSATSLSLVQSGPIDCGMSSCLI